MDKRQALCRSIWKEVQEVKAMQEMLEVQDDACALRRALLEEWRTAKLALHWTYSLEIMV